MKMSKYLIILLSLLFFNNNQSLGQKKPDIRKTVFFKNDESRRQNIGDSVIYRSSWKLDEITINEKKTIVRVDLNDYLRAPDDGGVDWNYTEIGDNEENILKLNNIKSYGEKIRGISIEGWYKVDISLSFKK